MSGNRNFADQYAIDVERMQRCLQDAGYGVAEGDFVRAWTDYSDSLCATWLMLPEGDDALLSILLKHIDIAKTNREALNKFTTTLIDTGDGTGDGLLELPDDLLALLGWREGDILSIEVPEPSVLVVTRLDDRNGWEKE